MYSKAFDANFVLGGQWYEFILFPFFMSMHHAYNVTCLHTAYYVCSRGKSESESET